MASVTFIVVTALQNFPVALPHWIITGLKLNNIPRRVPITQVEDHRVDR